MSVIDKIQINSTTYDVGADAGNVAYDNSDTYSSGTVGDEITQLKSDFAKVANNVEDIKKWSGIESDYQTASTPGAIYYSNGEPYTSYAAVTDAYKFSGYMRVWKDAVIKYKLRTTSGFCMIAFYSSPDTSDYVQSNSVDGTGGAVESTYIVPADGYIRITARNDLTDKYVTYTYNGTYNKAIDTRIGTIETAITPLIGTDAEIVELQQIAYSLWGEFTQNGFLNAAGAFIANAVYRATDYVAIKSGQSFQYNIGHGTTLPIICFYTAKSESSAQATKFVMGKSGYTSGTYTADADGYVRFCGYYTSTDSYVVFNPNIPDNVKNYLPPTNGVENLKILCLGDSIFGNDGEIVADLAALTDATVINGAFGGTRVTNRGGTDNFQYFDGVNLVEALTTNTWTDQDAAATALAQTYSWIPDRLATLKAVDMSTVNLITMDWGTNDYTGSATIEEITSAYADVIDLIQEHYPTIRILILAPTWRYFGNKSDNENGDNKVYNVSTLKEIAAAIVTKAQDMRVDVENMYQRMPLSYNTADTYFDSSNTVHLNAAGNLVYAHILRGKIMTMY